MTPTITPDILSQALNVALEKLGLDENEPIPTRTYDALIAFSHEIEWHKQKTAPAAAGVPENVARIPSDMVDGELSVASAIDQVVELFPSADRAALRTLAACLTHHSIHRYTAQPAAQPQAEQHPDDVAVDRFASAMKEKLAMARTKGRGGWEDPAQCTAADLSRMLREHVAKGDPRDVANFCMMLHQRGESIVQAEQQGAGDAPIVLPPVPHGQIMPPDDRTGDYPVAHDDEAMQDYAREAVEADRAARQPVGEPVAFVSVAMLRSLLNVRSHNWMPEVWALPNGQDSVPLYTAPPAAVDLQGWSIHEDMHGPGIAVCAPNAAPGAMVVENKGPLAQRLLYALASALTDSKAVRS